jgi:hypothetical protein
MKQRKPVYLLADSQLLFARNNKFPFLPQIAGESQQICAAYIGVNNSDRPEYYDMFVSAMAGFGIDNCPFISMRFTEDDQAALTRADLILIAGGETLDGWQIMQNTGMDRRINECYYNGALLIGISAGAVQLGLYLTGAEPNLIPALQIVPLLVGVHDEQDDWKQLRMLLQRQCPQQTAIGVSFGGGMVWHPDNSIQALQKPLYEFRIKHDQLQADFILPPDEE